MAIPKSINPTTGKKNPGWFSWRHQDGTALENERQRRESDLKFKLDGVRGRNEARAKRSSSEQITLLDSRLGVGFGAVKERKRLSSS